MIFGSPSQFAVEAEITSQSGTMVFGWFRIWACGVPIGRCTEEVIDLTCTTGRLREPISDLPEELRGLTPADLLRLVWKVVYGDDAEFDIATFTRLRPFVWIDSSEGFEGLRSVASCDRGVCRLVWQDADTDSSVRQAELPLTQYNAIASQFLAWLDRELDFMRSAQSNVSPNKAVNPSGGSGAS